jgi:hypothetical protein
VQPRIFFVTGVLGAGKTCLVEKALRDRLMQRYSDPAKVKDLPRMR